ncbi:MAG: hypothetical protein ACI8RZ_000370 [Myxococcota bacterium]|jgi:hypothetical protein
MLALLLACRPDPTPQTDPADWPGGDVRPILTHGFFDTHNLGALSLYATCVEGEDRPDWRHRGALAVGNGHAFALLGLADPLNTIHGMTGPTYSTGDRFFRDIAFSLQLDGEDAPMEQEWAGRPRQTGLAVTRGDVDGVSLVTVDYAPRLADGSAPPVVVRELLVRSEADADVSVVILARSPTMPTLEDGHYVDALSDRRLGLLSPDLDWQPRSDALALDLGTLAPGEERRVGVVLAVGEDADDLDALADLVAAADRDAWLSETLADWHAFSDRGLTLTAADQRWGDLVDGMRVGIRLQTTAGGGISPMSRYTRVWLRDTIGPVRFLLRAGLVDEAEAALDYLHACHVDAGDYVNSCSAVLDPEAIGEAPGWSALPDFTGRVAAEGPSYVPLAYATHAAWTGDFDRVSARWDYLSRGLLAQSISEDGLQPWSGDETFRLAMAAAFGYPLEPPLHTDAHSALSGILSAAAGDAMASLADALGEDAAPFTGRATLARSGLAATFRQPEGHLAAISWHTEGDGHGMGLDARPYEDVALHTVWSGAQAPDDAAMAELDAYRSVAGQGDGTFLSPLDPMYSGLLNLDIEQGVFSGMLPGYALFTLNALGDMESEGAFNAVHRFVDTTGQLTENIVYDDASALHILYDATGSLSDISARYRPWEGGIVLDAVLSYLLGVEPEGDGVVRLRPHLPNGQPWMTAEGLVVGDSVFDLHVEPDRITVTAVTDVVVVLESGWEQDGAESMTLPGGEPLWRAAPVPLSAGEILTVP